MSLRSFLVLIVAISISGAAHAQDNLTTIAYPVVDLVVPIPAYQKDEKLPTCENELMAHIRKKIAPQSWEQAGSEGTMRYESKGYLLHVRQTPKVHAELKVFLKQLEREQVSVEMRVVTMSEVLFERARGQWFEDARVQWKKNDGIESALLSDAGVERLLSIVQGDRRSHVMQMPKVTVYDGQECKLLNSSLQSQVLPTISAGRRFVNLQAVIENKQRNGVAMTKVGEGFCREFKVAAVAKIPDQHTIALLAGKTMIEEPTEQFPPMMARVPYANRMFRKVEWTKTPVYVIVLLTPRILPGEEAEFEVRPLQGAIQPPDDGKFPPVHRQ